MMKLNKFAQAVHENAVKHGWWDEERTFGEIIACATASCPRPWRS